MNITELRYLVAILQTGSVSAAAKQLSVAQPNVSKALKNLEDEYGLRIFERTSTGMLPTESGRRFIEQAARILDEIDQLDRNVHSAHDECAELRIVIPHTTYASYAAADFIEQMAGAAQMRVHVRECGAQDALSYLLRHGYQMALLRYAAEAEADYSLYCRRHGLHEEVIMEFESYLLVNKESPLAKREIHELSELSGYIEVLADDDQLPDGRMSAERQPPVSARRVHVYERHSQFAMLQQLPQAYMWASPTPQKALDQYNLVLRRCPARRQTMRDVLVYPEKGILRAEEQCFLQLLRAQAAQTVR